METKSTTITTTTTTATTKQPQLSTIHVYTWTGFGEPPLYPATITTITTTTTPPSSSSSLTNDNIITSPYSFYPYNFTQIDINKNTTHDLSKLATKQGRDRAIQWLFFERPAYLVDQIDARLHFIPDPSLLGRFAYYCTSGAWQHVWFRFGYDPRKDRLARLFQTIRWHIPQAARVPELLSKLKTSLYPVAKAEADKTGRTINWVYHFIHMPLKMDGVEVFLHNIWMLLDVKRKLIRKAVDEGVGMVDEITPRYGYFDGAFLDSIVDIFCREILDIARNLIKGAEITARVRLGDCGLHPLASWLQPGKLQPLRWTMSEPQPPQQQQQQYQPYYYHRIGINLDFEPSPEFCMEIVKNGFNSQNNPADVDDFQKQVQISSIDSRLKRLKHDQGQSTGTTDTKLSVSTSWLKNNNDLIVNREDGIIEQEIPIKEIPIWKKKFRSKSAPHSSTEQPVKKKQTSSSDSKRNTLTPPANTTSSDDDDNEINNKSAPTKTTTTTSSRKKKSTTTSTTIKSKSKRELNTNQTTTKSTRSRKAPARWVDESIEYYEPNNNNTQFSDHEDESYQSVQEEEEEAHSSSVSSSDVES
jgi:hypothetical protein